MSIDSPNVLVDGFAILAEAENSALKLEISLLKQVLEAYEQWEADIILENKCWTGQNVRLTDELWDRMIELQTLRNTALGRYRPALFSQERNDG
jgi:hypothetical protein